MSSFIKSDPVASVISESQVERKNKRGFMLAYCQRILSFIVTLGSTAVLARLLSPAQFGYVAMTMTALNFFLVFRDFGLTSTAIQKKELFPRDRDDLFWMNAFVVGALSIITTIASPLVAFVYGQPIIASLMHWATVGFFISGLGATHAACLRRNMDLGRIFVAEFGGILLGAVASIVLALVWRNAYAVICGALIQSFVTTIMLILLDPWLPRWHHGIGRRMHLLSFGSKVAIFNALNYITNNIGLMIVGMKDNAAVTGFFNRAQSLYSLPVSFLLLPYLQVQFPLLCRDGPYPDMSRARYVSAIRFTSLFFAPMAFILPVIARDITTLILGPQWVEAGRILSWYSPALLALGLIGTFGQYMTSLGRVSELRAWGVGDFVIRGGGAVVGSLYGPLGTAAGFSIATLLIATPLIVWICAKNTPVSAKDQLRASFPGFLVGLCAGACAAITRYILADDPHFGSSNMSLFIVLFFAFLGWLCASLFIFETRHVILRLIYIYYDRYINYTFRKITRTHSSKK